MCTITEKWACRERRKWWSAWGVRQCLWMWGKHQTSVLHPGQQESKQSITCRGRCPPSQLHTDSSRCILPLWTAVLWCHLAFLLLHSVHYHRQTVQKATCNWGHMPAHGPALQCFALSAGCSHSSCSWVSLAPAGSCNQACCQRAHQWLWGWCHPAGRRRRNCPLRQGCRCRNKKVKEGTPYAEILVF